MKALISFAVLSALVSCGPAPELKRRAFLTTTDKQTDANALTGKTDQDIIKMKYNGDVPLKCEFKIFEGSNVDLEKLVPWKKTLNAATKDIDWYPYEKELSGDRKISLTIMIDSIVIDRAVKTTEIDGKVYEMSFSPSVVISVKMKETVNGEVKRLQTIEKKFTEQVSEEIKGFDFGNDVSQELRCTLATTINAPYVKQWKSKGKKEVLLPTTEAAPEVTPTTGETPVTEPTPASDILPAIEVAPVTEVVPVPETPAIP